jgi:hypothetical protein
VGRIQRKGAGAFSDLIMPVGPAPTDFNEPAQSASTAQAQPPSASPRARPVASATTPAARDRHSNADTLLRSASQTLGAQAVVISWVVRSLPTTVDDSRRHRGFPGGETCK